MTAPSWPPDDRYPVEEWTDDELIDQYRYVKAEFSGNSDYLDSDESVGVLIQELITRGLDGMAEAVEDEPDSPEREAEGPVTFPP